jgi:hypothetical protein
MEPVLAHKSSFLIAKTPDAKVLVEILERQRQIKHSRRPDVRLR